MRYVTVLESILGYFVDLIVEVVQFFFPGRSFEILLLIQEDKVSDDHFGFEVLGSVLLVYRSGLEPTFNIDELSLEKELLATFCQGAPSSTIRILRFAVYFSAGILVVPIGRDREERYFLTISRRFDKRVFGHVTYKDNFVYRPHISCNVGLLFVRANEHVTPNRLLQIEVFDYVKEMPAFLRDSEEKVVPLGRIVDLVSKILDSPVVLGRYSSARCLEIGLDLREESVAIIVRKSWIDDHHEFVIPHDPVDYTFTYERKGGCKIGTRMSSGGLYEQRTKRQIKMDRENCSRKWYVLDSHYAVAMTKKHGFQTPIPKKTGISG